MKKLLILLAGIPVLLLSACDNDRRYYDLDAGKYISVEKDPESGYMINAETKKPVTIYVDTKTSDTIYGRSGKVINGHIVKEGDGKYKYNDGADGAYEVKDGDYKKEVEKDGDIKIKDGDTKTKIDGETGEKKVKKD